VHATSNLRLLKRDVHFLMETNELVMKMKKANKKQPDINLISFGKLNCEWNSKVEDITFSWNGIFICDAFVCSQKFYHSK
jgi:hypothetical protein